MAKSTSDSPELSRQADPGSGYELATSASLQADHSFVFGDDFLSVNQDFFFPFFLVAVD